MWPESSSVNAVNIRQIVDHSNRGVAGHFCSVTLLWFFAVSVVSFW